MRRCQLTWRKHLAAGCLSLRVRVNRSEGLSYLSDCGLAEEEQAADRQAKCSRGHELARS